MLLKVTTEPTIDPDPGDGDEAPLPRGGRRHPLLRSITASRAALAATAFLVTLVVIAVLAPVIGRHDPLVQDLANAFDGPSAGHWLGTDELGRDVFSRLAHGARVSLFAGFGSAALALVLGVLPGLVAGYVGGRVDWFLSTVNDAAMALPALILAIAVLAALGPGIVNTVIAIAIVSAPRVFRLVRATALVVREETYAEAARAIGLPAWRIIASHVVRNVRSPLVVFTALLMSRAILAEASLSFIGLGVVPPEPSWGSMLARSARYLTRDPWLIWAPGLAIALTVLALNVLGDAMRGGAAGDRS